MVIKRPTATAATRRIALEVHENAIFLASDGNQNTTHKHTNLVFDVKKTGDLSKKKKKNAVYETEWHIGTILLASFLSVPRSAPASEVLGDRKTRALPQAHEGS